MRFEAIESVEVEPFGDRAAFGLVGNQVDPLSVANLVEPQMMREADVHRSFPSARSASEAFASSALNCFNALTEWPSASGAASPLYRLSSAEARSPAGDRQSSVLRPSEPTSLRTVLPSVGSPRPSSRC